jgi:spore germination cell wall hydrolase CwlJ-like protein
MKRAVIAANAVRSIGMSRHRRKALPLLVLLAAPALGACSMSPAETGSAAAPVSKQPSEVRKRAIALAKADPREKECLVRAMYFESNRSSETGLLGVGTVVLNRVESPRYPDTICGVVGAPRQFASGVLTRPMAARDLPKVEAMAQAILDGRRNEAVGNAKHFHMAGLRFSYPNMHYVTVAGGNAFYVKGERPERRPAEEPSYQVAAAPAPVAPAPAAAAAPATAVANLVDNAPLPPSRPFDLDLPRRARAFAAPRGGARVAALMPGSNSLRGALPLE